MKSKFLTLILILLGCISICEATPRTWTSNKGTNVEANLVARKGDRVTLLTTEGRKLDLKISDLSKNDQKFLEDLLIKEAGIKIPGISAEPGKISEPIKCENSQWNYHIYLPKNFHMARKWPVWFIMSPGGGVDGKILQRYIQGAEATGSILVGSVESKNRFDKSQAAVEAMAGDAYKRLPLQEKFAFASGFSGGGRQSFLLAETNGNIAGVLACGADSGVYPDAAPFRNAMLRKSTYVYSLIGTNCFNRTSSYKTHQSLSDDCRLRFFPGNHDWANADLIKQGMVCVVGQAILVDTKLGGYKQQYLAGLKELIEDLQKETPWESFHLAVLGSKLDNSYENGYFRNLTKQLEKEPKVRLALQAEKDIDELCSMFYIKYNYYSGDLVENSERTKKGETLARPYSEIPHGELLKGLGQKCKGFQGKGR